MVEVEKIKELVINRDEIVIRIDDSTTTSSLINRLNPDLQHLVDRILGRPIPKHIQASIDGTKDPVYTCNRCMKTKRNKTVNGLCLKCRRREPKQELPKSALIENTTPIPTISPTINESSVEQTQNQPKHLTKSTREFIHKAKRYIKENDIQSRSQLSRNNTKLYQQLSKLDLFDEVGLPAKTQKSE